MRKLLLAALLSLLPSFVFAQGYCPSFATQAKVITAANLPYTIGTGDVCSLLVVNAPNATGVINLPSPGSAFMPAGYTVSIKNEATSGQITLATLQNPLTFYQPLLDLGTTTFNTPILPGGGAIELYNNGTDWFSVGFNAGTGPIYVNTFNFGAPGSNAPILGVTINGTLFYTANGVTQNVALYSQATGLNLSNTSFNKGTPFVPPAVCSLAPVGFFGNGPPEWLTFIDPLGYKKSIPLC